MKTIILMILTLSLLPAAEASSRKSGSGPRPPSDPWVMVNGTVVSFDSKSVFIDNENGVVEVPARLLAKKKVRPGAKVWVALRISMLRQGLRTPVALRLTQTQHKAKGGRIPASSHPQNSRAKK